MIPSILLNMDMIGSLLTTLNNGFKNNRNINDDENDCVRTDLKRKVSVLLPSSSSSNGMI